MSTGTKKNLIAAACYSGVFILGMVVGPKFVKENRRPGASMSTTAELSSEKMDQILHIIRDKYVDDVGLDTLQSGTIRDILKKLDPHSAYLPPENAASLDEDLEGTFNGIGITYYLLNDTLLVTSVNPGGPSARSGLSSGDRIVAIDGKTVAGVGIDPKEITRLIRGPRDTPINLLVKHAATDNPETLRITRGKVTVSSIDAAYLPNPQTGYIKISRFGAQTVPDFISSLEKLKQGGMKNLILDLRGNGGGYLNSATALADEFLGDKKLIVYTEGQHEPRTDYLATAEGSFERGKLVILIDENTASASEIVAGAVQDLDRGTIIGRRSFGKGLVQEQFPFDDGSALNLTIARYYTPSGRSIQRSYKNGSDAYYEEVVRRNNSELLTDSLYDRDQQYRTSSGRKVYGGGGIRPDIYVAPDTAGYNDFYYRLSASGFLNDYVYGKLAQRARPGSLNDFLRSFQVDNRAYGELLRSAAAKGITSTDSTQIVSRLAIEGSLKAILALYYFGDDAYYRVLNEHDNVIGRAMAYLQ